MKRQKMRHEDLNALKIDYFGCFSVKSKSGVRGVRYLLCNPMTEEQKKSVLSWKNTVIGEAIHRYAPEIKHQYIIITDKILH